MSYKTLESQPTALGVEACKVCDFLEKHKKKIVEMFQDDEITVDTAEILTEDLKAIEHTLGLITDFYDVEWNEE